MSRSKKIKAIIDDGMNPELVFNSRFDGYFGIPELIRPKEHHKPRRNIPFNKISKAVDFEDAICFNIHDIEFAEVLRHPENFVEVFRKHILICLDCSLYRNAPFVVQCTNVYKSRAVGSYFQNMGVYVIPFIRWGNSLTYTTEIFPEPVAFLGVPKHSIIAISSYGCVDTKDDKRHFKAGLVAMLEYLEPDIVLVYGAMPHEVFDYF